ncbi:hypothetical protein HK405_013503, partial [Cladochytrium tenue]
MKQSDATTLEDSNIGEKAQRSPWGVTSVFWPALPFGRPSLAQETSTRKVPAFDVRNDDAPGRYFVADDGNLVYWNAWKPPDGQAPVAVLLALHSVDGHVHLSESLYERLSRGFRILVKALDVRGFGRTQRKSGGVRGDCGPRERVLEDVVRLHEQLALGEGSDERELPTFVAGRGVDGLLALRFCESAMARLVPSLRGCIVQDPPQHLLSLVGGAHQHALLSRLLGETPLGFLPVSTTKPATRRHTLDLSYSGGSTDAADPLVHGRASLRLLKLAGGVTSLLERAAALGSGGGGGGLAVLVVQTGGAEATMAAGRAFGAGMASPAADTVFVVVPGRRGTADAEGQQLQAGAVAVKGSVA